MSKNAADKQIDTQMLTEEYESQDLTQNEEFKYPVTQAAPWGKLEFVSNPTLSMELKQPIVYLGREDPILLEKYDCFLFSELHFSEKTIDRISKQHLKIERDCSSPSPAQNFSPAILTCLGRNGIYVNNEKLQQHDKRILKHKDYISLQRKQPSLRFHLHQQPPEIDSLPDALLQKFYVGNQIGSGGCGVVRLAWDLKTLKPYAMKVIAKEVNEMIRTGKENNDKIMNEVNIMKKLSHPNVVSMIQCYETPSNVVIIMDYMQGRDLLHRITAYDPNQKYLSESYAKFLFMQACYGLKYLHDSGVVHRDIKPDNILCATMDEETVLKISDFGLSKLLSIGSLKTVCGTQLYVAPEILRGRGSYDSKVDIWSLGCMLFAMLSGTVPFSQDYGPPITEQIMKGNVSFMRSKRWNKVSSKAINLVKLMLQKDPKKRPSIDEVLANEWLKCPNTICRVNSLMKSFESSNDTIVNSGSDTEIEITLQNVSLNETVRQPPAKKQRLQ